jgi:hypothetical protein
VRILIFIWEVSGSELGRHCANITEVFINFPQAHPAPSSAEVKERVELYLCFPFGPSWPVLQRNLPLPFTSRKVSGSAWN